jgi:PAS domain S-box-containing protein
LRDPVEIQAAAVHLLGQHLEASRVTLDLIDGDECVVSRACLDGVAPFGESAPLTWFGDAMVQAWRRGETIVVSDVRSDPRLTDTHRAQLLAGQIAALVGAPLTTDGRWVATFGVYSTTPHVWTPDQVTAIELTAERIWVAAARAKAEESLKRIEDRRAFLQRFSDTIGPLSDPARILAETCRLLGTHLRVERVAYGRISGDDCVVADDYVNGVASMAGKFRWTDLAGSRLDEIMSGGVLVTNDTATDPRTAANREALQSAEIGAYACPLLVKDGQWVAAFGIHSRTPRVWTADEIALAQDVAERIWATLERRKAEGDLRANQTRLEFLLRLNDALRPLNDPGEVQETAARLLGLHLGVSRCGYGEVEGRDVIIRREYSRDVLPLAGPRPVGPVSAKLRAAFQQGNTVVVHDVHTDTRFTDDERLAMRSRQIAAFVGVTLVKGGQMVAAFGANHDRARIWSAAEVDLVTDVAERTWDAVQRTRAEGALRHQEHRLRLAIDASAGGSWTWDAANNQVDWDPRFRALYGFAPDEPADTQSWMPRVHEDDRPRVLALLDEILKSKEMESWENTFRAVRPDGTIVWIQSRGRADRDADGHVTRLTGLDLDFNQYRQTEEAVQARREEERDRALRLLLETSTQGIVSVDAQGLIVTANRAFETMFGWGPEELIGRSVESLMPAPFRDAHTRHRAAYFGAPRSQSMGAGRQLIGQRKDGSTFPIEVGLNHVSIAGLGHAFAFVTDSTERQRAAAALQERTSELEHRTLQLSQMASDLTLAEQHAREQIAKTLHDGLQQLLVIVSLNLEQQVKRETEAGGASDLMVGAKQHLDEAIAAARSLSFELSPPVLHQSNLPVALTWLANWTRQKYGLDVQVTVDPRADSTRKDVRTLLFESVRELLFNVVKHAQVDRVALDLALDGDRLCITVADEGVGFDPAALDRRSKDSVVAWGLFSIRERVTLLGGRLEIDSAPGRGTKFRLVAPLGAPLSAAADADAASRVPVARTPDAGLPPFEPLRILIADDHAAVRQAMREILQERPELALVGDAANGIEAIACAHTLRPDVILMDVSMPLMDGIEATRRLRLELPSLEILGLSMQPRPPGPHAIEEAGAAGYFVKGVDTKRLIDHLLRTHAARAAGRRSPAKHPDSGLSP